MQTRVICSILSKASAICLMLAIIIGYHTVQNLSSLPSADCYEDKGVYAFVPYKILPEQVKNNSASGRDQRMRPYKTVYMVYYRDTKGDGYQWKKQAITREIGQKIVNASVIIERRVLYISDHNTYITIESNQTAERYISELQQKYIITLSLSGGYILFYILIKYIIWLKKKKNKRNSPVIRQGSSD